jgi:hypothetical protein
VTDNRHSLLITLGTIFHRILYISVRIEPTE